MTVTGYRRRRRAPGTGAGSIRRPMAPRIYTKTGDDGTTGLLFGGRVRKDSWRIELNGAVDEAQAALGLARAEAAPGSELDDRADRAGARPLRADGRGGHRPGEPRASSWRGPRW